MKGKSTILLIGLLIFLSSATAAQEGFWRPDYEGIKRAVELRDSLRVRDYLQYNKILANANDSTRWTLLHMTAGNGDVESARFLLEYGASLDVKSKSGLTPLHEAIRKGNSKVAMLLIAHGANINLEDSKGTTPLKMAIDLGRKDIAEALQRKGATK